MMRRLPFFWLTGVLLLALISPKTSMPFEPPNNQEAENNDEMDDMDESFEADANDFQLIQGDIVQDAIENDGTRNQAVPVSSAWYNAKVPYVIHPNIKNTSQRQKIKDAMRIIESVSCIEFKERRKDNDRYFITIFRTPGPLCFSYVGAKYDDKYINVGQALQLGDNCFDQGTILHELMHAIGFPHEQARTDRDEFVEIIYDNIPPEYKEQFNKRSDLEVSHLNTTYDYYSIMHYKWNAFARDENKPTIKVCNDIIDYKALGNRKSLSPIDIIEINSLYNCPGKFAEAQNNLGNMYYSGKGATQSYAKAVEWYAEAAEQGHAQAQRNLGFMYENGQGVPQSNEKAVEWYVKAAKQGYAVAQTNLGFMYWKGHGVPQSIKKAVEWFAKAAEQGDANAQNSLGFRYEKGQGVPQSNEKAAEWYGKAAEQDHADAQYHLGAMYYNGKGVPQSYAKAVEWYAKAAEQDYAVAQTNLGFMYEKGYGVPQSNEKAAEWYARAAVQGHANA